MHAGVRRDQVGFIGMKPGDPVVKDGWCPQHPRAVLGGEQATAARLGSLRRARDRRANRAIPVKGRTSADEITYSERGNLQGAQFFAVAGKVYELARRAGLGREIPTEWFLQDIRN